MDMTDKTAFAPGCYGSALAFTAEDDICRTCPFRVTCEPRHLTAMAQLREMLHVTTSTKRRASSTMSVAAEQIFEGLGKSASDIRKQVLAGRNPFSMRDFLGDVVAVLLNSESVNRAFLAQVLERRRAIKPSVADKQVRQAIQILTHCGVIETTDGVISLCRE